MLEVTPDLAWQISRNHHAYIMKRPHCKTFSREAFNLKGIHSQKYNGFIPNRVVDVTVGKKNKGLIVSHRTKHYQYMPSKNFKSTVVRKSNRTAFCYVRRLTRGSKCRKDLEMTALARASTLARVNNRVKGRVHKRAHLRRMEIWKKRDAKKKEAKANKPKEEKKAKKTKASKTAA